MDQIYFDIVLEICRYLSCKEIISFLNCSTKLRKHTKNVLVQIIRQRFQKYEVNINNLITRNKNLIALYNSLSNKYINGPHGVTGPSGDIGTCPKYNWNNNSKAQENKIRYIKGKKNYIITRNQLTRGNRINK